MVHSRGWGRRTVSLRLDWVTKLVQSQPCLRKSGAGHLAQRRRACLTCTLSHILHLDEHQELLMVIWIEAEFHYSLGLYLTCIRLHVQIFMVLWNAHAHKCDDFSKLYLKRFPPWLLSLTINKMQIASDLYVFSSATRWRKVCGHFILIGSQHITWPYKL